MKLIEYVKMSIEPSAACDGWTLSSAMYLGNGDKHSSTVIADRLESRDAAVNRMIQHVWDNAQWDCEELVRYQISRMHLSDTPYTMGLGVTFTVALNDGTLEWSAHADSEDAVNKEVDLTKLIVL